MTTYQARSGVLLTSVCNEYILVAARSLKDVCPYVTVLNETSAFLWKQLKDRCSVDMLLKAVSETYQTDDPEKDREAIEAFIKDMKELGYLGEYEQDA